MFRRKGKIESMKVWRNQTPLERLPADLQFVCAYDCGWDETESLSLERRGSEWALWFVEYVEDELRGWVTVTCSGLSDPREAAIQMIDALVDARANQDMPGDVVRAGLIDAGELKAIVDRVWRRRAARRRAAAKLPDAPIVAAARKLGLDPEPVGESRSSWQARCPGGNHYLMVGAESGQVGCGYCRK
jgi:hypothetical protein